MTLPNLSASTVMPKYEITIPSTGKKIFFRPFIVKEEKILLMALQSKDSKEMISAIKQTLSNCISGVDIDSLSYVDLEWIFLKLMARSKGDVIVLPFRCIAKVTDKETGEIRNCGTENKVKFDINNSVETVKLPGHEKNIEVVPGVVVAMKYPGYDTFAKIHTADQKNVHNMVNISMDILYDCVDAVFQGEEQYSDFTKEELTEFFDNMPSESFEKVRQFFRTMPKLRGKIEYKCHSCGHEETINLEGLASFLG